MNPNIKNELGVVVIAMILVARVLTFSLTSHLQSVDAKKVTKKDKYVKLRESLREQAQREAATTESSFANIFGGNVGTNLTIGIAGADGISNANGTDGADGADGINCINDIASANCSGGIGGAGGKSLGLAGSAAGGADGSD